jgi:hypothetical protein
MRLERQYQRMAGTAIVLLAGLLTVAACGSEQDSEASLVSGAKPLRQQSLGTCVSAQVFLGERPGVIKFKVACNAPHRGGIVRFSLQRSFFDSPRSQPGIKSFRHRPLLTGQGALGQYGLCVLRNDILGCRANADGSVAVLGSIAVSAGKQCQMNVLVRVIKLPPCIHGECTGAPKSKTLASGRPSGC